MGTLAPHSFPGVGTAGENTQQRDTVGKPDGPMEYIPQMGIEVPTFLDPCEHMRLPKDSGMSWLMYHVPMAYRGYYRLEQLHEQYRAENSDQLSRVRTTNEGFVLCDATTNQGTGCRRRAVNYSGWCQAHGGKLHPLDKVVDPRRTGMLRDQLGIGAEPGPGNVTSEATLARMTRWQKLLSGVIKVEDLDDEELARGMCRDANGSFTGSPPRMVPKDMHDRMVRELFQRADQTLREGLLDAAGSIVEIARGSAYEPADRIKAATWLWERLRGKVADVVVHTQDKPWEMVLSNISGGSRAASRAARGVADEEEILEAQLVSDPGAFDPDPAATSQAEAAFVSQGKVETYGLDEYDPDDPLQNPGAGLADEPDPVWEPTHELDYFVPAIDPEKRQNEEYNIKKAKEEERLRQLELKKTLDERRKSATKARYAARSRGMTETLGGGLPYTREAFELEDGTFEQEFTLPKVTIPKKKRNDDFRHTI